MTHLEIKAKLVSLGIPAALIDITADGVAIRYDVLHANETRDLRKFYLRCTIEHTDKTAYIIKAKA
jgi:hypothetical protein